MDHHRPINAGGARARVAENRRKTEELQAAERQAAEIQEVKDHERVERIAQQREVETKAAVLNATATVASQRAISRCLTAALEGHQGTVIRFELESSILSEYDIKRIEDKVVNALEVAGFKVQFDEDKSEAQLNWEKVKWEKFRLAGDLNAGHVAWITSVSGHGLLSNIWAAIASASGIGNGTETFGLVEIPRNKARWGPNSVQKVLLQQLPIGVLPAPVKFLLMVLRTQGFKCTHRLGEAGGGQVHVEW